LIKILFVCHGNICRSPMAEFIMKDMVRYRQLEDQFYIDSAALSTEDLGHEMHQGVKAKLESVGVPYDEHKTARMMTSLDYAEFDYIIAMDDVNMRELRTLFNGDPDEKTHKLLEFAGKDKDIEDPWFTGDFDDAYDDILVGLSGLLKSIKEA
jgi:protein-tyrosine phosphatase